MTEELQRKVDRAVKLIQAAGKVAKEHGHPLEICYSGGKDSDVILELARMAGIKYRAIYKKTTIDPPESHTLVNFKDAVEWFTFTLYCDTMEEWRDKFGPTLFDDGIDCHKHLSELFGIDL